MNDEMHLLGCRVETPQPRSEATRREGRMTTTTGFPVPGSRAPYNSGPYAASKPSRRWRALLIALSLTFPAAAGLLLLEGRAASAETEVAVPAAYAPYAFLIGEWDVSVQGGKPAAVSRFRWSPAKTYIWWSGAILREGKEEPSWEGLLVWNGVRKKIDFLVVLDPASGNLVQEQGTLSREADGTVKREITAFYSEGNPVPPKWDTVAGPEGARAQFRHTFRPDGPDRILSTVMRKTEDGWVPNFPGSDRLVMTRRTSGP